MRTVLTALSIALAPLSYSSQGRSYGAEQYLPGRRVIWTFLDGECQEGSWYEEAGLICFVYENNFEPQCWSFWERGGGLAARKVAEGERSFCLPSLASAMAS